MKSKVKTRSPRGGNEGHYERLEGEPIEKILVSIYSADAVKLRRMTNYNKFVRLAVRAALEASNE